MPAHIELSTFDRPYFYARLSSDPPGDTTEDHHGLGTPSTNVADSGLISTFRRGQTEPTTSAHSYSNVTISGHGRMHAGNVYNYNNAKQEEREILEWLAPIDLSYHHGQACQQYSQGTLNWFFRDGRFRTWRDDEACQSPSVLWCQGEMGTGKTTLMSQVLERLLSRDASQRNVAVIYCRLAEQSSQSAESILGLVLAQLYQNDDLSFDIPPAVKGTFESRSYFWLRRPSLNQLTDWLVSRVPTGGQPAFVLVDALDELHPLSRKKLLHVLESPALKRCPFRLLITSRYPPEHEADLFSGHPVEIRAQKEDLQRLVNTKLSEHSTEKFRHLLLRPARDPRFASVREEISQTTIEAAQ